MRSILLLAVVPLVIGGLGAFNSARAAALAFDSAADPAYAPYLSSGGLLPPAINGGYGWGSGWESAYYSAGSQPAASGLELSNVVASTSTSPILSSGPRWLLPAALDRFENTPGAKRLFDGVLEPGQSFSFDFFYLSDFYLLGPNGTSPYWIEAGGEGRFQINYFPGQYLTQQVQLTPPNSNYPDEGEHFSFTPINSNNAILSVTWYGPDGGTASTEMPYSTVDGISFYNGGIDFSTFVNNFSITPEPQAAALFAAVGFGLLLRRSRRSRSLIA